MKLKHKFVDGIFEELLEDNEHLCVGDKCIYCQLIIDEKIHFMFVRLLKLHNINFGEDIYKIDLEFIYKIINEKYPCITEEEYIIKQLLE